VANIIGQLQEDGGFQPLISGASEVRLDVEQIGLWRLATLIHLAF